MLLCLFLAAPASPQSISGGTISGTVKDPSGAAVPGATVVVRNPVSSYEQSAESDSAGAYRFNNVPLNSYQLNVTASGFSPARQAISVANTIPLTADVVLTMAEVTTSVNVSAAAAMVVNDPSAHTDADSAVFSKLPSFDPAAGLSSVINNSTGGTASDANGFFHPLGDHAQVSFVIDGQPVSDQQSKVFSTQLPANAVQSLQLITGAPDAQYGDKSSLVVNATTKSGLGAMKPIGSVETYWGSFGTWGENADVADGTSKLGEFATVNFVRTGHFLDTPEFLPIHAIGNNESIFDRIDYEPTGRDAIHLNFFVARNWFQVPNDFDQLSQDQKQRVLTWNIAPGYQHTFGAQTLLTINPFVRRDQVNYYGSRDPLADNPAAISQTRFLTNYGAKADLAILHGRHSLKFGTQARQTRLLENFSMGITNPALNPVCLGPGGVAEGLPGMTNPAACGLAGAGYYANPNLLPGLLPYDLTRGGTFFLYHGLNNVTQEAFYATDQITFGQFQMNIGLRLDHYAGLVKQTAPQPRLALSYMVRQTGTVLRAAYSRTMETPFNENLLLSSATGAGGLAQNIFGAKASVPLEPGARNQFNGGFQQRITQFLIFDGDYFWKFTHNAYDFDVLFNTPITFPIAWHNSKVDGLTGRLSSTAWHGLQAYLTFGHSRARYFPPEVGGLIFQGTASVPGVFRIDHDQAYQQTANLRYQHAKSGIWADLIWRYDSGLVVTGIPTAESALLLTPNQQVDIGLTCNGVAASVLSPLRSCSGAIGSALLTLPPAAVANNDHNPDRVKPRDLFDVAFGKENIFRSETVRKVGLRLTVTNLSNKVALYNFLSTFSGTHFVAPRTTQIAVSYSF
ncbi:MAG TPA: TonB-dependent receptor [Bryobacteraceae bacterium]|nr:TonB-dependent receptor [Bryobacteraceae bacterium]